MVLMIPMVLKNKETKTIKMVTAKAPTAKALTAETTADTRPRNGLMVLMIPMVLKNKETKTITIVSTDSANSRNNSRNHSVIPYIVIVLVSHYLYFR